MHGEPTGMQREAAPNTRRTIRKRTWIAIGLGLLMLATTIGAALVLDADEGPKTYLELYITDLPADFSRFDVRIAAVQFGAQRIPLELDHRSFDLLALRGPEDALRIARGHVPVGEDQTIHIRFESASLELDHQRIDVDIPESILTVDHDYGLDPQAMRSVLFDIDVEDSLTIDGPDIRFEPVVKAVYIVADGAIGPDGAATSAPAADAGVDFAATEPKPPQRQTLEPTPQPTDNPFEDLPQSSRPPTTVTATTTVTPTPTSQETSEEPAEDPNLMPDAGDQYSTVPDYTDTMLGWFIQYAPDSTDLDTIKADVEAAGAEVLYRFESVPALYVAGQELQVANLSRQAWAEHVEPVVPVSLHLSSSKPAIRAAQIQAAVGGLTDAQGRPIDGRGVGVAVVDSGIDGLHPDLTHFLITGAGSPVRANFKVASNNLADMPYTDTTSGHGTHVAGIVAGRGTKDPSLRGVAAGATLYGFGIGELANTFWTNQAFDWIVSHGHNPASGAPPIRVVTNSWGTAGAYDPNSLTTRLVNQMVAKGMVVVFSAGNAGGDGFSGATTSSECRIPTPGVLCVAWYDDQGGSRDGLVADQSSRGQVSDPSTWPDISAPGSTIRSARTPFGWVTGVGLTDYYVSLDGTSMAAPHVAGAAALMLQAKPGLSPAQIETMIESTAYKYAHKGAYATGGSHYAKGHGLLDAYAAVQAAKAAV